MKIIDAIHLAFKITKKEFIKSKKNFLVISLILLFTIISFFVYNTLDNTITSYEKSILFKTIIIDNTFTNEANAIKKIQNIITDGKVFSTDEYQTGVNVENNTKNNYLQLVAGDDNYHPEIIMGRELDNSESKQLICPDKIIFDGDVETNFELSYTDIIDGKTLLNKNIIIQYSSYDFSESIPKAVETFKEEYTIVGLYNSNLYNTYNTCYTPSSNIKKINEIQNQYLDDDYEVSYSLFAVLNENVNPDLVLRTLKENGYSASSMVSIDSTITIISYICKIMSLILSICGIISIALFIIKDKNNNKKKSNLYVSLGFNKKELFKLNIILSIVNVIISFIIAIAIFTILYCILLYVVKYRYIVLNAFKLKYPIVNITILFTLICIILFIINLIFIKKEYD